MKSRVLISAMSAGLAVLCALAVPATARAQADASDSVRRMTRLGGPTRFTAPVRSVEALRRTFTPVRLQNDVGAVLAEAGVGPLKADVVKTLSEGAVTPVTIDPGTRIVWMARRRNGPHILRTLEWNGRRSFRAFQFEIDDRRNTYTFIVPEDCGNLALLKTEPSRLAARDAAEAAQADAARRAAAARADAEQAAAAKAAAERTEAARRADDTRRADDARKAELARQADEARRADEARKVAEAQKADASRLAAERAAEKKALAIRPFVAGFVGKQQRQYDEIDPSGLGAAVNPVRRYGDALAGGKVGAALRLRESAWSFNPAIGVAGNVEHGKRSSALLDLPLVFNFEKGIHLGSGVSLWDFTHKDITTFSWLGEAGFPVWKNEPAKHQLDFQVEWRQFFDRGSDPDTNYQFWGGLRYLFK